VLQQATLRCRPRVQCARWFTGAAGASSPAAPYRASARLWDGTREAVLFEGVDPDVDVQGRGLEPLAGAPALPEGAHRGRISVAPGRVRECALALAPAVRWCAELGVGTIHVAADEADALTGARATAHAHEGWMLREAGGPPGDDGYGRPLPNAALMVRIKAAFDPDWRLNPTRLPLPRESRS